MLGVGAMDGSVTLLKPSPALLTPRPDEEHLVKGVRHPHSCNTALRDPIVVLELYPSPDSTCLAFVRKAHKYSGAQMLAAFDDVDASYRISIAGKAAEAESSLKSLSAQCERVKQQLDLQSDDLEAIERELLTMLDSLE